jgi:hypothetical protein
MECSSDLTISAWPALAGVLRQLQEGLTQEQLQAFYEGEERQRGVRVQQLGGWRVARRPGGVCFE